MKCLMKMCLVVVAVSAAMAGAAVTSFMVDTNQFGYQGSVYNATDDPDGLSPWAFPSQRDGTAFFANNVPGWSSNYNAVQSNWYQHPLSNQNLGFFQLNDDAGTVTSAAAEWTYNGSTWDFTCTISGTSATMHTSASRLWQPDRNIAYGGTYTAYTYTISATGMATAIDENGWRYNIIDPTGITGSFDGTFFPTQDVYKGPEVPAGETYVVHLDFNKNLWDATNWSNTYGGVDYGNYSYFAAVPEPATMLLLGLGGLLCRKIRKA